MNWSGAGAPPLQVGDIISGTSPTGFMRRITSINVRGSVVRLQTADASMTDAVQRGQFSSHVRFDKAPQAPAQALTLGAPKPLAGAAELDWDLSGIVLYQNPNLTVDIPSGRLTYDPEIDFDWDFSWYGLSYARLEVTSDFTLDIDLRALAQVQGTWRVEKELFSKAKRFTAGYLEGRVEFSLIAELKVEGKAQAEARSGFRTTSSFGCKVEYFGPWWDDEWNCRRWQKRTFSGKPVVFTMDGGVTVTLTLVPQLSVILYEVCGPSVSLEPYLEFWGNFHYPPAQLKYALRAGLDLGVGIDFGILDDLVASAKFGWSIWGPKELISGATPLPSSIKEITITLPGNVPLVLVRIPPRSFQMGSNDVASWSWCYPGEQPVHTVNIPEEFYMGKYEVTQRQWVALMGSWPGRQPDDPWNYGYYYPAYFISWNDCRNFITALNYHVANTRQGPAAFRLPSEAEWEYACRAGSTTRFCFGDSTLGPDQSTAPDHASDLDNYAWFGWPMIYGTHEVGGKQMNLFGLYDMHGNVWEWCQDWYHSGYTGAPNDGRAWETPVGTERVMRGGAYENTPKYCRSACRSSGSPNGRFYSVGFRVVRAP
jgi:formylglycine-generating enzyme required for sulfatase activity